MEYKIDTRKKFLLRNIKHLTNDKPIKNTFKRTACRFSFFAEQKISRRATNIVDNSMIQCSKWNFCNILFHLIWGGQRPSYAKQNRYNHKTIASAKSLDASKLCIWRFNSINSFAIDNFFKKRSRSKKHQLVRSGFEL